MHRCQHPGRSGPRVFCVVIHDACATRDLVFAETLIPARQVHGAFMAALASFYAGVISLEEFMRALE